MIHLLNLLSHFFVSWLATLLAVKVSVPFLNNVRVCPSPVSLSFVSIFLELFCLPKVDLSVEPWSLSPCSDLQNLGEFRICVVQQSAPKNLQNFWSFVDLFFLYDWFLNFVQWLQKWCLLCQWVSSLSSPQKLPVSPGRELCCWWTPTCLPFRAKQHAAFTLQLRELPCKPTRQKISTHPHPRTRHPCVSIGLKIPFAKQRLAISTLPAVPSAEFVLTCSGNDSYVAAEEADCIPSRNNSSHLCSLMKRVCWKEGS